MQEPFRVIDLFAGAGGLTCGFTMVRTDSGKPAFEPVWANDFNEDAAETYNANFGDHCTHGDIVDILEDPATEIPEADVVVGGPPCQGFSLLNKNRDGDPRKQLWRPYMEIVERSGARVFVMENVRQLLSSAELHQIRDEAERLGFEVESALLCSADYGVPQVRHRAFIIGMKGGSPARAFPPKKTHCSEDDDVASKLFAEYVDDPQKWRTVEDAIANLPEPVGTEIRDEPGPLDLHFGRSPTKKSQKRYRAVPPGGNRFDLQRNAPEITPQCWIRKKSGGTDLFGRLWWDRPSVTIRTEFFKPEKDRHLHPVQHRAVTYREAVRVQPFPNAFEFHGSGITNE